MTCPKCSATQTKADSQRAYGQRVYRWRHCEACGYSFRTCEQPEKEQVDVQKVPAKS